MTWNKIKTSEKVDYIIGRSFIGRCDFFFLLLFFVFLSFEFLFLFLPFLKDFDF